VRGRRREEEEKRKRKLQERLAKEAMDALDYSECQYALEHSRPQKVRLASAGRRKRANRRQSKETSA